MTECVHLEGIRFPIRPTPEPDESFLGYVLRLVATNGIKLRRDSSIRLFGSDLSRLPFSGDGAGEVARLSGVHGDWVKSMAYRALAVDNRRSSNWLGFRGVVIHRHWVNSGVPKICLSCLREEGTHYRFLWDFRFFSRCPLHGHPLVNSCANCAREFTWASWLDLHTEGFRCVCGASVLDDVHERERAPTVAPGYCDAARYVAYRLAPEVYPQWHRALHADLSELPTDAVLELILYLGSLADLAVSKPRRRFSPTAAEYVERRLAGGFNILTGWPGSFRKSLKALVRTNLFDRRKAIGSAFGQMDHNDVLSWLGAAEPIVRRELTLFKRSNFYLKLAASAPKPKRGTHNQPKGMIASSVALRELGLSASSLRCLLKIAHKECIRHRFADAQWWFDAKAISSLACSYKTLVGRNEIDSCLWVGEEAISELRQSFHLPLVMRSIDRKRALTCEVSQFKKFLGKASIAVRPGQQAADNFVGAREALGVFRKHGLSCADLVDAIVDDVLPAVRFVSNGKLDWRLYFHVDDLRAAVEVLDLSSPGFPRNGFLQD